MAALDTQLWQQFILRDIMRYYITIRTVKASSVIMPCEQVWKKDKTVLFIKREEKELLSHRFNHQYNWQGDVSIYIEVNEKSIGEL